MRSFFFVVVFMASVSALANTRFRCRVLDSPEWPTPRFATVEPETPQLKVPDPYSTDELITSDRIYAPEGWNMSYSLVRDCNRLVSMTGSTVRSAFACSPQAIFVNGVPALEAELEFDFKKLSGSFRGIKHFKGGETFEIPFADCTEIREPSPFADLL